MSHALELMLAAGMGAGVGAAAVSLQRRRRRAVPRWPVPMAGPLSHVRRFR